MHYIFLDTNIYLHFRDFEEIDWEKVTQQRGAYEFVLAPIVFSELDKHKYNNTQKTSRKAKEIVNKLYSTIKKGSLAKVIVHNQKNDFPEEIFTRNTLSRLDADDNLIAAILSFKAGSKGSDLVTLVTYDAGPKLKAEARGIRTVDMDELYLLKGEVDESERTIKKLQKELGELKNRIPKIELHFTNGSEHFQIERKPVTAQRDIFISSRLKTLMVRNPILDPEMEDSNPYAKLMPLHSIFKPTPNQKDDYNEDLKTYYSEYKEYLGELYEYLSSDSEILKINLVLTNSGNVPAEDIDVTLFFSKNLNYVEEEDCPKKPEEPEAPKLKRGLMDFYQPSKGLQMKNFIFPGRTPIEERIELEETSDGFELKLKSSRLKQHTNWAFPTIHISPSMLFAGKGFPIKYEVIIANVPNRIEGQLNLTFA